LKNEKKWSYFNSVINSQKKEKINKITKQFLHHISAFMRQILSFFEKPKKKKKNWEIFGFLF
jgi:hypothetical protein